MNSRDDCLLRRLDGVAHVGQVRFERRRVHEEKLLGKDARHFVSEVEVRHTGPGEEKVLVVLRAPVSELAQLKVRPLLQTRVDEAFVREHRPDVVVLATGATATSTRLRLLRWFF